MLGRLDCLGEEDEDIQHAQEGEGEVDGDQLACPVHALVTGLVSGTQYDCPYTGQATQHHLGQS